MRASQRAPPEVRADPRDLRDCGAVPRPALDPGRSRSDAVAVVLLRRFDASRRTLAPAFLRPRVSFRPAAGRSPAIARSSEARESTVLLGSSQPRAGPNAPGVHRHRGARPSWATGGDPGAHLATRGDLGRGQRASQRPCALRTTGRWRHLASHADTRGCGAMSTFSRRSQASTDATSRSATVNVSPSR